MIIHKTFYEMRSSGIQWWEKCSKLLSEMGLLESHAESDIWICRVGDHYEYIIRYFYDISIDSHDQKNITDTLMETYHLKLKGTLPIGYHLGYYLFRYGNGKKYISPRKYIQKILDNYVRLFGENPGHKVL